MGSGYLQMGCLIQGLSKVRDAYINCGAVDYYDWKMEGITEKMYFGGL